jgi:hypothetical protein
MNIGIKWSYRRESGLDIDWEHTWMALAGKIQLHHDACCFQVNIFVQAPPLSYG